MLEMYGSQLSAKHPRSADLRVRSMPQTEAAPRPSCRHRALVPEARVLPMFCMQRHPLRGSDPLRTRRSALLERFLSAEAHWLLTEDPHA